MRRIFISHAYSGDPQTNNSRVSIIARDLVLKGHFPLAPQIYLPHFVDETRERDLALGLCLKLVELANVVRVYGEPTAGMRVEIAEARRLDIPVVAGDSKARWALTGEPPR